jgi:hypothetical protein
MGHITHPHPTPPRGRGAEGEAREGIIAPLNKVLTLEKVKTILLCAHLIVPLNKVLTLEKVKTILLFARLIVPLQ